MCPSCCAEWGLSHSSAQALTPLHPTELVPNAAPGCRLQDPCEGDLSDLALCQAM